MFFVPTTNLHILLSLFFEINKLRKPYTSIALGQRNFFCSWIVVHSASFLLLLNLQSCLWSVLNQQQPYLAEYFQNKLVETIQFMEVLNLKDSVEKDSFFRKLPNLAEQLPRQIVLKKV